MKGFINMAKKYVYFFGGGKADLGGTGHQIANPGGEKLHQIGDFCPPWGENHRKFCSGGGHTPPKITKKPKNSR